MNKKFISEVLSGPFTLLFVFVCYLSKAFTFTSAGCKILSNFDTAVFQEELFKKSMLLLKIKTNPETLVGSDFCKAKVACFD